MLTKKKLFACLGIIIVGILALSGCASSSSGSSGSGLNTGPGVDVAHKTITLGILSPYSGPVAAPIGDPLALGVEGFFDHVNDIGGIHSFQGKFVWGETQEQPQIQVEEDRPIP